MTAVRRLARAGSTVVAIAVAACAGGCAHAPLESTVLDTAAAPVAGDSTVALWHFDETTGLEFADDGAARRDGVLGVDTRPTFGRFRNARLFSSSINSFGLVAADRSPDLEGTWTIEAWVKPSEYGPVECNVIAGRWTDQPNEQGWMMGLVGFNRILVPDAPPRPNWFDALLTARVPGALMFAFQPEGAGSPRAFTSTVAVERDRWTHVAVSFDGHELRLYLDGRLNAQFANIGPPRQVHTPLEIGNTFDPRVLTESQGPLRVPEDAGFYPFYAFLGAIDELRLSSVPLGVGPRHP